MFPNPRYEASEEPRPRGSLRGLAAVWPALLLFSVATAQKSGPRSPEKSISPDIAFVQGFESLRYGDPATALTDLSNAWAGGLCTPVVARVLGEAALLDGRPEAADQVVLRGLEIDPSDRRLGLVAVRVLTAAGRPGDAQEVGSGLVAGADGGADPALLLAIAAAAGAAGDHRERERLLAAAAASEDGRLSAHIGLAELALERGCPERADSLAALVDRRGPRSDEALRLAVLDRSLRGGAKAEEALRSLTREDPASAPVALALADLLRESARSDEAESVLRDVLAAGTGQPIDIMAALAELEAARERPSVAHEWLDAAVTETLDHPSRRLRVAGALVACEEPAKAYELLLELRDALPRDPRPCVRLAEIERAFGGSGERMIQEAWNRQPRSLSIRIRQARALRERGEPGEALKLLAGIGSPRAALERARCHLDSNAAVAALEELGGGISREGPESSCPPPWEADLWALRTRAHAIVGAREEARRSATRAIALAGDRLPILESVAISLHSAGETELEIDLLREAAQRLAGDPSLRIRVAEAWLRHSQPDSAARTITLGRASAPWDLSFALLEAELFEDQGRETRSRAQYAEIARAGRIMAAAELERAEILHRMGILEVAREAADRATRIDPGCLPCWDELWNTLAELDRSQEAVRAVSIADSLRRSR